MSSLVQKLEITRNFCQFADESEQFFVPLLNEAIAFAFSGNEITPPRIFFPTIQSLDLTRQLNNFEDIAGDIRKKVQTSCFRDFKIYYCCDNYDEMSAMLELNINLSKIEALG